MALGELACTLYTGKIDVWAIGVIYYIMLAGRFPFNRKPDDNFYLIQQICAANYDKYVCGRD